MNYNISEINYKNYVLGTGWPSYKNISIKEMSDNISDNNTNNANNNTNNNNGNLEQDNSTAPRYDSMPGNSRIEIPVPTDINPREARLVKELYFQLNKILAPYVERIVTEYEYVGSPIYDEEGVDRETISQLVAKVIELAEDELDDPQEIRLEATAYEGWTRKDLLNNLVQSLVLTEIFMVRRPRYRRARNNYRYSNGMYDGINPQ
jgi:hypothetical protein